MVLLAFSLQDQVEKYGAYVGIAAFFGLAVLSLLYFAQAREVKRLREWAGRAPERAAEVEAMAIAHAEEARRTPEPAPAAQPANVPPGQRITPRRAGPARAERQRRARPPADRPARLRARRGRAPTAPAPAASRPGRRRARR